MIWIIKKTDKPFTFKTESADGSQFIIFKIDDPFNGKEIDVSSTNLSKDNVRFIRETLPTPEEDSAAIGTAYLYDENEKFIDKKVINATPIEWNCNNPKLRLEIDL